jgi:fido (protein-threonine AMPylation protein)
MTHEGNGRSVREILEQMLAKTRAQRLLFVASELDEILLQHEDALVAGHHDAQPSMSS